MDYAKNTNKVLIREPFIENNIGNDSDLFWDVEHICTTSLALISFNFDVIIVQAVSQLNAVCSWFTFT